MVVVRTQIPTERRGVSAGRIETYGRVGLVLLDVTRIFAERFALQRRGFKTLAASNQHGGEELVLVRNPAQFACYLLVVSLALRHFLDVAVGEHVLQLRVALLKPATAFLLRDLLFPLHLQTVHIAGQHVLHLVRTDVETDHVVAVGDGVHKVQITLGIDGLQTERNHLIACCVRGERLQREIQVLRRKNAVLCRHQREGLTLVLTGKQHQRIDGVAVGLVVLQLRLAEHTALGRERQFEQFRFNHLLLVTSLGCGSQGAELRTMQRFYFLFRLFSLRFQRTQRVGQRQLLCCSLCTLLINLRDAVLHVLTTR